MTSLTASRNAARTRRLGARNLQKLQANPLSENLAGSALGFIAVSSLAQGMWTPRYPIFDLTALGYALSLPFAVAALARSPRLRGAGSAFLLLSAVAIGHFSPVLNPGAGEKRLAIALGVVYTFCLAHLVLSHERRIRAFLGTIVGIGLVVALGQVLIPDMLALTLGRRTPMGLNPIGAGRALGAAALIALCAAHRARSVRTRVLLLAGSGLLLAGLSLTGSRGPAVGVICAAAVLLWATPSLPTRVKAFLSALLAAILGLAIHTLSDTGSRLAAAGDSGRSELYVWAWRISSEHPWGIGWGNSYNYLPPGLVSASQGYDQYAHNIVLEFLTETGWIGAGLFVLVSLRVLHRALRSRSDHHMLSLAALFIFSATSAMFSSDLVGNRLLWVVMGAVLALSSSSHASNTSLRGWLTNAGNVPKRPALQIPPAGTERLGDRAETSASR